MSPDEKSHDGYYYDGSINTFSRILIRTGPLSFFSMYHDDAARYCRAERPRSQMVGGISRSHYERLSE